MVPDLTEQERLALIAALKLATNQYYEMAWTIYGPNGRSPNEGAHAMLMRLGDEVRELGRKFGDPMD